MKGSACGVACVLALLVSLPDASCHRWGVLEAAYSAVAGLHSSLSSSEEAPWFCHDLECPDFKVVASSPTYETRKYAEGYWASTEVDDPAFTIALAKGSAKLFGYLSGKNSEQRLINRTLPVTVTFQPIQGFRTAAANYTTCFYLPAALGDSPPTATDPAISVEALPPFTLYVASFPGYALGSTILSQAAKLAEALKADGVAFEDNVFHYSTYDPPTRFTGRHNEVAFATTAM